MDLMTASIALAIIGIIFSISIYARRTKTNINPSEPKAICGTPLVYSGQLSIRPEILAADAEFESQGYAAIKHHDIEKCLDTDGLQREYLLFARRNLQQQR